MLLKLDSFGSILTNCHEHCSSENLLSKYVKLNLTYLLTVLGYHELKNWPALGYFKQILVPVQVAMLLLTLSSSISIAILSFLAIAVVISASTSDFDHISCTIPRRPLESINDVNILTSLLMKEPVIFHDTSRLARHQYMLELASKESIISQHGDIKVYLTSSNTYSQGMYEMTLREYISLHSSDRSHQDSSLTKDNACTDSDKGVHHAIPAPK